jgi:hypothetical protein
VQNNNLSTFSAGGESRRVVSFIIRSSGSDSLNKLGGNAEVKPFVPCVQHREERLFCAIENCVPLHKKRSFTPKPGKISGGFYFMLDLKFVRENPEIVKQNIRNKFQEHKLPLVDEVIELDAKARAAQSEADDLRAKRNQLSKEIGKLMGQGKKDEAEAVKAQVSANAARLAELEEQEKELSEKVTKIMMTIPNIIDPSVPIGKDDSCNVEIQKYGDPVVPDFEVPYHTEIMERFNGIDLDAAGKVAGNGFYYLMGDIARLHSAVISYAFQRCDRCNEL